MKNGAFLKSLSIFTHFHENWACANNYTYIKKSQWSVVIFHLDTEDMLDLAGEHVHGSAGSKSADERVRHEGRHIS